MVLQMCCGIIKVTRDKKKIMSAIISCTSVYINPLIICTENRKQLDYEIVETLNENTRKRKNTNNNKNKIIYTYVNCFLVFTQDH